jgi:two-component system nitrate/nitrite response regulator NarL
VEVKLGTEAADPGYTGTRGTPLIEARRERIRIVLVNQVLVYRAGVIALLEGLTHLNVVASTESVATAARLVHDDEVDVVLLDLGGGNAEAAQMLLADAPEARVVVLAAPDAPEAVIALAEAGVLGYVTRDQSAADLAPAIESVARDEMACPPWIATLLVRRVQALAADRPRPPELLTPRESEILALVANGLSNREIASRLHIELTTVKNHVHKILATLGARTRAEAVALVGVGTGSIAQRRVA